MQPSLLPARLPRQITSSPHSSSPYHQHNQASSSTSNPIPNRPDNTTQDILTLPSLALDPLSRTADGYQPLQLPPHCTHPYWPGCTCLLLLRPAILTSIRWKEGARREQRAPSGPFEISYRNLTLRITRAPLYSKFLPIWVFEPSTQSWLPSTSDSSASPSSPDTAKTIHSTNPNRLARAVSSARIDRVHPLQEGAVQHLTSPDFPDPPEDFASPSNHRPH